MNACPTDWVTIITIIACLFAVLAVIIGLFLYLANKIDSLGSKIESLRGEVYNEMRDFHGRLCSLEERYKTPKTNP